MSVFSLLLIALWVWALVDILINEFTGYNKFIWLIVITLIPLLGVVLYYLVGTKQKITVSS